MLYAGTERGVVFSADDGKSWQPLQLNLPTVPVHDLIVKGNDLVLGTHGRSLWIFDDLTPIRTFGPAIAGKAVDLLPPPPATRWRYPSTVGAAGQGRQSARRGDPPLWLKEKPKAKPKLEILDAERQARPVAGPRARDRARSRRRPQARRPGGKEPAGEEQEAKEKEEEQEEEPGPPGGRAEGEAARQAGTVPGGLGPGARPGPADQGRQDRCRKRRGRSAGRCPASTP